MKSTYPVLNYLFKKSYSFNFSKIKTFLRVDTHFQSLTISKHFFSFQVLQQIVRISIEENLIRRIVKLKFRPSCQRNTIIFLGIL